MLDKIMEMVKGQVVDTIGGISGIPEDKKSKVVETTTSSLVAGLKQYATPDNLSNLTSMFGIGKSSGGSSMMTSGLESGVVSALTSKVGLSPAIATTIASAVIPVVMSLFKSKINDTNEPGFSLDTIIGGLTGGSKSSGGGVMDMLGNMFGNK